MGRISEDEEDIGQPPVLNKDPFDEMSVDVIEENGSKLLDTVEAGVDLLEDLSAAKGNYSFVFYHKKWMSESVRLTLTFANLLTQRVNASLTRTRSADNVQKKETDDGRRR